MSQNPATPPNDPATVAAQENSSAPQMQNETLGIDDKQPGTRGGAPMGIALAVVGGLFLLGALITVLVLMSSGAAS